MAFASWWLIESVFGRPMRGGLCTDAWYALHRALWVKKTFEPREDALWVEENEMVCNELFW